MRPVEFADVVVVGGGSCGCVVAARLGEDPARSVLLLEAGPAFSAVDDVPGPLLDATTLPIGPDSEWVGRYEGELTADVGRAIARGRVLGGSGAVNGGYFVRATPGDFDAWPQSLWSFDQVLPFYIRSETDLDVGTTRRWHGSRGPMPVRRPSVKELHPTTVEFVESATGAGFRFDEDMNAPDSALGGVGLVPSNIRDGVRVSAAVAYLFPIASRKNVRVQGNTTAVSLIFKADRVIGVETIVDGERRVVRCDTVVVSAGAVNTPALLLRSGIGPAESSVALGISVVADSPGVGRGFSDHPEVAVPVVPRTASSTVSSPLQAVLHAGDVEIRPYTRRFDRLIPGLPSGPHVFGVGLMRSTGRGSITLGSTDPFAAPEVRYHYLESESDRQAMLGGIELAHDVLASSNGARKGSADVDPFSALGTSVHLSGSAKMGPESDPEAVLDDHCRVRGVAGVFVVDTSAFPVVPSRGPHATAIMFAERAAALIADHSRRVEA